MPLVGVDLSNAAYLQDVQLAHAELHRCTIVRLRRPARRRQQNLRRLDLLATANLQARISEGDMTTVPLNLEAAQVLRDADFEGSDLSAALIWKAADFLRADLRDVDLGGIHHWGKIIDVPPGQHRGC